MIFAIIEIITLLISAFISNYCVQNGLTVFLKGSAFSSFLVFIIAFVVLFLGFLVFLYKKGKLPSLSGVAAGQIYTLARASILVSITLISLWTGTLLGEFSIWNIIFDSFNVEILAIVSAIVLFISGCITCLLCRNDFDDNESNNLEKNNNLLSA